MKASKQVVDHRRELIIRRLREIGHVEVNELVESLHVSALTIRRDLQYWEDQGYIERNYGGAVLKIQKNTAEVRTNLTNIKLALARMAVGFIKDGDTIFVNTSSTALMITRFIKDLNVTIITNNGKAILVEKERGVTIHLTGGEIREPKEAMVGDIAINTLSSLSADLCIVGCSGFTLESGMTTTILPEVAVNKLMIEKSKRARIIVADHTKLGKDANFIVCSPDVITHLITDRCNDPRLIEEFRSKGIHVIEVDAIEE